MHIHELNPKRTMITLVAFAILLLVGFLTMNKPLLNYSLNMNQSLQMLEDSNAYFYPSQLADTDGQLDKEILLIDLRNNFEFGQGHIPGSENISAYDLTLKENIKRLQDFKKENITVVFYGDSQLQANGPWMLFRQLGFDNIKILLGGYEYYKSKNIGDLDSLNKNFQKEVPRYNYAQIVNAGQSDSIAKSETKSVVKVVQRKKEKVASGGC
jgi:rhodanese-related sulfurtransferase